MESKCVTLQHYYVVPSEIFISEHRRDTNNFNNL